MTMNGFHGDDKALKWAPILLTVLGLAVTLISSFTSMQVGRVSDQVQTLNDRVGRVEAVLMGNGRR